MKLTGKTTLRLALMTATLVIGTAFLPTAAAAEGDVQGVPYIESRAAECSGILVPKKVPSAAPNEANQPKEGQKEPLSLMVAITVLEERARNQTVCTLLLNSLVPPTPAVTAIPETETGDLKRRAKSLEMIEYYLSSISKEQNCKQHTTKPSCLYIVELATRTSSFLKILSGGQARYEYLGDNSNDRGPRDISGLLSDTPSWDFNFPEDAFRTEALAIRNSGGSNDDTQYKAKLCDTECQERGLSVARLLPISSFLLQTQKEIIQYPILKEANSTLTLRESQWSAYAFGGGQDRVQLPWEIALNSYLYSATKQPEAISLVPGSNKDQLVGLNDLGKEFAWPEPPKGAWTLLHPSVGFAPFRSNGKSSSLGITVEAIGYSWWNYNDKGARTNEWGLSIGAAWHNLEGNDDISPALVIRTPLKLMGSTPLTLAISTPRNEQRKRETLVSLNVDLSKLFSTDGTKDSNNLRARIEQLFGFKK